MSRQFVKGAGESFPDITRFKEEAPEPERETASNSHTASAYAVSCENRQHNSNLDALMKGEPTKQQNIKQVAEGM